jgi:hypothetical protein
MSADCARCTSATSACVPASDDGARAVAALLAALDSHAIAAVSVTVGRPSLDDVCRRVAGRWFPTPKATPQAGEHR